jgi:hypothetical protein
MHFDTLFTTYIAGFLVNVLAALLVYLPLKKLFDWLPTSAELHERFRAVRIERNANDKIVALTPLLFISFYWLFVGNMIWALTDVIMEVLRVPNKTRAVLSYGAICALFSMTNCGSRLFRCYLQRSRSRKADGPVCRIGQH